MSQRGIEISSLLRHLLDKCLTVSTTLVVGLLKECLHLAHQVHTIGNHNKHHPHVFGKREQQIAEVLTLHGRVLFIKLPNATQSFKDTSHRFAVL